MNHLQFKHSFASSLPKHLFTRQAATPLSHPELVAFSQPAAAQLNLNDTPELRAELTAVCSGNAMWLGADPLAMVYSGHQFGMYNPQLGDGRGLLLGEVSNDVGVNWDVYLKGSGPTPYSRDGDGRAVLRSCIREFLGSEALFHLGLATTRALCVVSSDTPVYRETLERGSTLLRLATTHLRFGHFEYASYSGQPGDLQALADYSIQRYFPHLQHQKDKYLGLFKSILDKTAHMVAQWQSVGFAHGVMNTDNMSIVGETFDYGPFGFMDDFDWGYICNHSDYNGRYAFGQQPDISHWNAAKLGAAMLPLFDGNPEPIQKALDNYPEKYTDYYNKLMCQKLGLSHCHRDDELLINSLLQALQNSACDYTRFFRALCDFTSDQGHEALLSVTEATAIQDWLLAYSGRLKHNTMSDQQRSQQMKQVNPKYILRNYLAQQAIEQAEEKNYSEIEKLQITLQTPFDEHPDCEYYAAPPPQWAKTLAISCSS
ncbi:MAG: YdiU family protein [Endozoicomonas sp. (ex Botrylloides leachii)]|nr:YdiU family protein [Endozoicomonas sp. (ex Botrylloides leachii)]